MKKALGVLLIFIAILLFICSAFVLLQLIRQLSTITFGAYQIGYLFGYLLVVLAEIGLGLFLFRKGKKLVTIKD